ncbi:hypothetical protein IV203_019161 [Nitzschia inconspicua]|uniref:Uncharacterized protein n=1 Tax=Nitzschia inconspicua TaxID=303405 RepID=A0A9K3M1V0_9STRA|nr:hypothetical protein IV203_019161 [Nitzschia inconspicua]
MPTTRSQSKTRRRRRTSTTTASAVVAATKKATEPSPCRPAKKSKKQQQQQAAAAAASKRRKLKVEDEKMASHESKLMDSIDNGKLRWCDLPEKYKKDVEFALCCRHSKKTKWDTTRFYFHEALQAVTDKERLFREWACVYPQDLQHESYLWAEVPEQVKSDRKLMKIIVNIHPDLFWVISQNLKRTMKVFWRNFWNKTLQR